MHTQLKTFAELYRHSLEHPDQMRHFFYLGQIIMGVAFLCFFLFKQRTESQLRESEPTPKASPSLKKTPQPEPLKKPLQLEGILLNGTPHEILGVPLHATPTEIQQAYRILMKRYHPDRIGRPGSQAWRDAQKIAEAINQAKERLLPKNKKT